MTSTALYDAARRGCARPIGKLVNEFLDQVLAAERELVGVSWFFPGVMAAEAIRHDLVADDFADRSALWLYCVLRACADAKTRPNVDEALAILHEHACPIRKVELLNMLIAIDPDLGRIDDLAAAVQFRGQQRRDAIAAFKVYARCQVPATYHITVEDLNNVQ